MNEFVSSDVKSKEREAIKTVSTKVDSIKLESIKFVAIKRRSVSETDSDEIFFDARESPKSR